MLFDRARLRTFVEDAMQANVSYLAVRRDLHTKFVAALDRYGDIDVNSRDFITFKTFLTSKDPRPKDDARLAYEVALCELHSLVVDSPRRIAPGGTGGTSPA